MTANKKEIERLTREIAKKLPGSKSIWLEFRAWLVSELLWLALKFHPKDDDKHILARHLTNYVAELIKNAMDDKHLEPKDEPPI